MYKIFVNERVSCSTAVNEGMGCVRNGTSQGDTRGLGRGGGVGRGQEGGARSDGGARSRGRVEVVVSL